MSANQNAETAHQIHQLFNEGKLDEVLQLCAEDVEVVLTPFGQTERGRDGFMRFMRLFHTAFPDLTIRWVNQVVAGDQVAVECVWTGTHKGPLASPAGTIPPTGKRVTEGRFCEIF